MRAAGIGETLLLFALGLAFVHSGAAGRLWERVERDDTGGRTGPTWTGALTYLAIYCAVYASLVVGARLVSPSCNTKGETSLAPTLDALRFLLASCLLVAVQVLTAAMWLPAALAILLLATLVDAYIIREPLRRAVTHWAWSGAGVALATLLIHPYFVGQPLFVVRLAVLMTLWDWTGQRLGVSPRLTRFVPSLYCPSASACTAAQARVAR